MQTPEALAAAFIERLRLPPGVRGEFETELIAMLRSYGDARAREERERCAQIIHQACGVSSLAIARALVEQFPLAPQPHEHGERDEQQGE